MELQCINWSLVTLWKDRLRVLLLCLCLSSISSCALLIPERTVRYIRYPIKSGDTIYGLSNRFGVSSKSIIDLNHLSNPNKLEIGQIVKIPYEPGSSSSTVAAGAAPNSVSVDSSSIRTVRLNQARKYVGKLTWPVPGARISSPFGRRWLSFHEGLDLTAPSGTTIYAAHSGLVVYSNNGISGYGNLIVLKGDGLLTVYGHNSRNLVRAGERVDRGEKIALVGATGHATGPHLHFETRVKDKNGKNLAVNPMAFYR